MVAAGLALVLSGCRTAAAPPPLPEGPGGPLLVLAATDAGVWVQLLRASGASARVGTLDEMLERRAGVITPGAELVAGHTEAVRRWVARGGRAVSAHAGVLRAVGFSRPAEVTVDRASMDGLDARWPQPDTVRPLAAGGSLVDFRAHASGAGATLVASARLGRGAVLAVAMDPIKRGEAGYERLPSLGRLMASWTEAPPGPARTAAEIYVDPTTFPGTATELAARLAGAGTVHVAGWHLDAHPYEALIDALHAQGVLAYAWLDGPAVGGTLWDDHPECREQTAAGRDAQAGGRKLVALEEPACMDLAWKTWERLVTSYPWDGVNVSGLHFEPAEPAEGETPYHPAALARFGGDPRVDPERFRRFRTELVAELNEEVLRRLNGVPRAAGMGFALTTVAGDGGPGTAPAPSLGTDPARLAGVATAQGAALHVVVPAAGGAEGPQRLNRVAPAIAALMPPGQGVADLVVGERDGRGATGRTTAAEFDLSVMAAAQGSGRVGVLDAGAAAPPDLDHLPRALGASVQVFDSGVKSPSTVTVSAPGGAGYARLRLDGQPWPAAVGHAVVPAGDHRLEWIRGAPEGPSLLRLTGELGTAALHGEAMTFSYDSRPPALAVVDPRPVALTVDGVTVPPTVVERPSGGFVVTLPPGTHRVELRFGADR
jgi:hypothetical protein